MSKRWLLPVALVFLVTSAASGDENKLDFHVHPRIIGFFSGWMTPHGRELDPDYLISLDLNKMEGHLELPPYDAPKAEGDWARWESPVVLPGGRESVIRFGYGVMGRLDNGYYVILTSYDAGGSGVFKELMVFDLAPETNRRSRPRALRIVDRINLGDQPFGKVIVEGNAIRLGVTSTRHYEQTVLRYDEAEKGERRDGRCACGCPAGRPGQ